jgi:hypothetical protein
LVIKADSTRRGCVGSERADAVAAEAPPAEAGRWRIFYEITRRGN